MPLPVQVQRFGRILQKKLGLQGYLALTTLDDLQPVVALVTGDAPEDFFLRDEHRWMSNLLQPGVAGQFSMAGLRNPPASGKIAVIEAFNVTGGAGTYRAQMGGELPAGTFPPGNTSPRDGRIVPPSTVMEALLLSNAAHQVVSTWVGGADIRMYYPGWVLPPATNIRWEHDTVNTPIQVNVWWREYPFAPQELTSG
jgi:hypothetical protein